MEIITLPDTPAVMGIINMSPDSFYPQSRCKGEKEFENKFSRMISEGAGIIDIGGCSTRPGSEYISEDEEWNRLKPVLQFYSKHFSDFTISIDTFRAAIAQKAFDITGPFIINDISSGEDDPRMLETAGRLKLPYIAMHKKGTPLNMQQMCNYEDVTLEVRNYFINLTAKAQSMGIKQIILDPGFGFAKNTNQNYQLLNNLKSLKIKNNEGKHYPLLAGLSRKSMIYKYLSISPEESLPATCALELTALFNGANIIRAHDVKEAVQTTKLYEILKNNN